MTMLPPGYLNAVVSIEIPDDSDKFQAIATGFLVGFSLGKKNENGEDLYKIFLVTNRHVFINKVKLWLRFNKGQGSMRYEVPLLDEKGEETWLAHQNQNVDIAVMSIPVNKLQEDGVEFSWIPDNLMIFQDKIKSIGVTQGDEIFILGFPMGLAGEEKKYIVVRGGIIARLDEEIIKTTHSFLIDSFIFPGNSGGPVILKPSNISIEGTSPINNAYLLGIIKGYIPYEEIAYSLQSDTPQPRIKFVENSGLASVIPLDYVRDIVSSFITEKEVKKQEEQTTVQENKEEGIPSVVIKDSKIRK